MINILKLNKCYLGDNLDIIKNVDNNSIDLYLFSPPYDNIRDYKKNEWTYNLPQLGKEISRTLKDGGMCVMVIQDQTKDGRKSLTSFKTIVNWCENTELDLWECCIYSRNGKPGAWWNKRFRVDHEYLPIFIKGKRPQYFNKEHMKIDCDVKGRKWSGNVRKSDGTYTEVQTKILNDKKCCGTIIKYKSSADEKIEDRKIKLKHPATFPDRLASDFIQAFTTENMIVCDPFAGSGTTLVEAKKLNRQYIGMEINNEYIENIINPRINKIS